MRNGRIAPWKLAEWISDLSTMPMWLGLGSQNPFDVDDPLTIEISGPVYRRPQANWQSAGATLLRSGIPLRWPGLVPGTRVTCVIGWTQAYNGDPVAYMPLPTPLDFPAGGTFSLDAGQLYLGADV